MVRISSHESPESLPSHQVQDSQAIEANNARQRTDQGALFCLLYIKAAQETVRRAAYGVTRPPLRNSSQTVAVHLSLAGKRYGKTSFSLSVKNLLFPESKPYKICIWTTWGHKREGMTVT